MVFLVDVKSMVAIVILPICIPYSKISVIVFYNVTTVTHVQNLGQLAQWLTCDWSKQAPSWFFYHSKTTNML